LLKRLKCNCCQFEGDAPIADERKVITAQDEGADWQVQLACVPMQGETQTTPHAKHAILTLVKTGRVTNTLNYGLKCRAAKGGKVTRKLSILLTEFLVRPLSFGPLLEPVRNCMADPIAIDVDDAEQTAVVARPAEVIDIRRESQQHGWTTTA